MVHLRKPLVCIVGGSCSGKTSLLNTFVEAGYDRIVPYTTRLPRGGEVNGVDYNFCSYRDFVDYTIQKVIDQELIVSFDKIYDIREISEHLYYFVGHEEHMVIYPVDDNHNLFKVPVYYGLNKNEILKRDSEEDLLKGQVISVDPELYIMLRNRFGDSKNFISYFLDAPKAWRYHRAIERQEDKLSEITRRIESDTEVMHNMFVKLNSEQEHY